MSTTSDPHKNLQRAVNRMHQASARGAQIVCLPELFRTQYFCQSEDSTCSTWPSPSPARHERAWPSRAKQPHRPSSARSSSSAPPASTTTRPSCSTPTGRCAASIARCTSPTTRSITRSTTSRRATSGSSAFDTSVGRVGTLVCWDQWYPEGRAAHGACRAPRSSSIPRPSAGTRREGRVRRGPGRRLGDHPARPRHRQRRLRRGRQPGRPRRDRQRRRASSSGAARSSPIRSAASSPRRRHDKEEILIVDVRPRAPGRRPPQLALPARPPDRRLRPDHQRFLDGSPIRWPSSTDDRRRPRQLGYRMPAEWEPHAATWLAWPHDRERLAGQIRAHPLGLRRDRPPPRPVGSAST